MPNLLATHVPFPALFPHPFLGIPYERFQITTPWKLLGLFLGVEPSLLFGGEITCGCYQPLIQCVFRANFSAPLRSGSLPRLPILVPLRSRTVNSSVGVPTLLDLGIYSGLAFDPELG